MIGVVSGDLNCTGRKSGGLGVRGDTGDVRYVVPSGEMGEIGRTGARGGSVGGGDFRGIFLRESNGDCG